MHDIAYWSVAAAFIAALFVLQCMDVLTTNAFLEAGKSREANPIVAWAQAILGKTWWAIKLPYLLVIPAVWWTGPQPFMLGALFIVDLLYGNAVWGNYTIMNR